MPSRWRACRTASSSCAPSWRLPSRSAVEPSELREKLLLALPSARAEQPAPDRATAQHCGAVRAAGARDGLCFPARPPPQALSIGYDAEAGKVHAACYDLLASEARIANFIAVAKGEIPQESWFLLSRSHVVVYGQPVLISWTGTMFEYLMPSLWMRSYPDTMLERSKEAAVLAQQEYADDKAHSVGHLRMRFRQDGRAGRYGYRAFGVPQLALQQDEDRAGGRSLCHHAGAGHRSRRGDPQPALDEEARAGSASYGYYEAADFTPDVRPSRRQRYALVRSWMVHHQGMSLLAIANFLEVDVVQQWFRRDARVQATELLLQEACPVRPLQRNAGQPASRAVRESNSARVGNVSSLFFLVRFAVCIAATHGSRCSSRKRRPDQPVRKGRGLVDQSRCAAALCEAYPLCRGHFPALGSPSGKCNSHKWYKSAQP